MKRVNNLYKNLSDINNIIRMTDKVLSKVKNKELFQRVCFFSTRKLH